MSNNNVQSSVEAFDNCVHTAFVAVACLADRTDSLFECLCLFVFAVVPFDPESVSHYQGVVALYLVLLSLFEHCLLAFAREVMAHLYEFLQTTDSFALGVLTRGKVGQLQFLTLVLPQGDSVPGLSEFSPV